MTFLVSHRDILYRDTSFTDNLPVTSIFLFDFEFGIFQRWTPFNHKDDASKSWKKDKNVQSLLSGITQNLNFSEQRLSKIAPYLVENLQKSTNLPLLAIYKTQKTNILYLFFSSEEYLQPSWNFIMDLDFEFVWEIFTEKH